MATAASPRAHLPWGVRCVAHVWRREQSRLARSAPHSWASCVVVITRNQASVTAIGGYAFRRCADLTTVEILGPVAVIETGTFYGCGKLASVTLPPTLVELGNAVRSRKRAVKISGGYFS